MFTNPAQDDIKENWSKRLMLSTKTSLLKSSSTQPRFNGRHWRSISILVLAVVSFSYWAFVSPISVSIWNRAWSSSDYQSRPWRWNEIVASKILEWHDCRDGFECAKVDLPLDWLAPSSGARVAIAVIKLKASDLRDYKGSVFFNPGGPGGSGVFAMRHRGKAIQGIIGRNHDLISFDPRGVGSSTPAVKCFTSNQNAMVWALQDVGSVDSHPGVLYDAHARSKAISESCASTMGHGNSSPLKFMSTPSVARDMLEILQLTGEQKLKYWGFSYGTVLGGTFATLYPDRVERMVNDGNVDLQEWFSGSLLSFLDDADEVMNSFYKFCHQTGPSECPFYAPSPSKIETRLEKLLQDLKIRPVIVLPPEDSMELPELISYTTVKQVISASLYLPLVTFSPLAHSLTSLESRDGRPFLDLFRSYGMRKPFSCSKASDGLDFADETDEVENDGLDSAFKAILCSDSAQIDESVEAFEEYSRILQESSKATGAVNVQLRMSCAGWKIKAKWQLLDPITGNTSFPILFISNSADNVTPLGSAQNNSRRFPNSFLLVQEDSFGHSTLSSPSVCTASRIRAYFQNGELPSPNISCKADMKPFNLSANESIALTADEMELKSATLDLLSSRRSGLRWQ